MFTDMQVPLDALELERAFRAWLADMIPAGTYRAWLAENADGAVAAGGGITIIPWPPGPRYAGDRLAFVYNVYTEPAHRRRGLARLIMDVIHAWCHLEGIGLVGLNASSQARPLYESMGYQQMPAPMMMVSLAGNS